MNKPLLTQLAMAGIFAGGFALTACNKGTESTPATGISATTTLAAFQAECTKLGGTFETHTCTGLNTCKGYNFQDGKPVAHHDCTGHSACVGSNCKEPA